MPQLDSRAIEGIDIELPPTVVLLAFRGPPLNLGPFPLGLSEMLTLTHVAPPDGPHFSSSSRAGEQPQHALGLAKAEAPDSDNPVFGLFAEAPKRS